MKVHHALNTRGYARGYGRGPATAAHVWCGARKNGSPKKLAISKKLEKVTCKLCLAHHALRVSWGFRK
jgi:hypothetical protein